MGYRATAKVINIRSLDRHRISVDIEKIPQETLSKIASIRLEAADGKISSEAAEQRIQDFMFCEVTQGVVLAKRADMSPKDIILSGIRQISECQVKLSMFFVKKLREQNQKTLVDVHLDGVDIFMVNEMQRNVTSIMKEMSEAVETLCYQ